MADAHDAVPPVTETDHDTSWSANLETDRHADDRALVVAQAREAVARTTPGHHVNLVTHAAHGHPEGYLTAALRETDADLSIEYVEQCGCGGHVTRVHVESR
jgi:putative CGCGG family rSAM target protein